MELLEAFPSFLDGPVKYNVQISRYNAEIEVNNCIELGTIRRDRD